MRLFELDTKIRTANQMAVDAANYGLTVNRADKKRTLISLDDEYAEKLKKLDPTVRSGVYGWVNINRIEQYPEAKEKLLKVKEFIDSFQNPETMKTALHEKFYEWIAGAQEHMNQSYPIQNLKQRYQLYVPRDLKHKTGSDIPDRHKQRSWYYEFDDEGNVKPEHRKKYGLEEDLKGTLLPTSMSSRKGGNKPFGYNAFWTSSLKKKGDGYGSEWTSYISKNGSDPWKSNFGYVYEINPNARILCFVDDNEVVRLIEKYNTLYKNIPVPDETYSGDFSSFGDFPWDVIHHHWDAIHIPHPAYSSDYHFRFGYGYDCESTVWFHPNKNLTLKGKVPISYSYAGYED